VTKLLLTYPKADRLTTLKATVNEAISLQRRALHKHRTVTTHVLGQRAGVPYELERRVCKTCGRELEVRRLRRAAAA
jgi:hypothetical protein